MAHAETNDVLVEPEKIIPAKYERKVTLHLSEEEAMQVLALTAKTVARNNGIETPTYRVYRSLKAVFGNSKYHAITRYDGLIELLPRA